MPNRSYLVCATPRSGSTLLCEMLKSTGVAGRPEEFFEARRHSGRPRAPHEYFEHDPGAPDVTGLLGPPKPTFTSPAYSTLEGVRNYAEHLERAFQIGTTPNGVFGAKLMWGHLHDFTSLATDLPAYHGLELDDLLPAVFPQPRYVHVIRRDKVRQAVSLLKAIQTENWRGGDTSAADHDPEYHEAALDHLVRQLSDQDASWEAFFARNRIKPLTIAYEDDLSGGPQHAVRRVLRHLGLSVPPSWRPPEHMRRQADELSDRWVSAYRERATATTP
jgi:LPS sulfotransferase NodH